MANVLVKGYCAGMLIFRESVSLCNLRTYYSECKDRLVRREYIMTFGSGQSVTVTEICIDVYEVDTGVYRHDLSTALKL